MLRKTISVLLAALLLFGCAGAGFAQEAPQPHWAQAQIDRVVELGILTLDGNGDFRPDQEMTRGMFLTALGRMAGIDPDFWPVDYLSLLFTDVDPAAYYAPYLSWAVHNGVVTGASDGRFQPDAAITREQMAVCITRWLTGAGLELKDPEFPAFSHSTETEAPTESEAAEPEQEAPVETGTSAVAPAVPAEPPADEPEAPETAATLAVLSPDDRLAAEASETAETVAAAETEAPSETAEPSGTAEPAEPTTLDDAPETETQRTHSDLYWQSLELQPEVFTREHLLRSQPTLEDDALLMGWYTDANEISAWARESIVLLTQHRVLGGIRNDEGGKRFAPRDGVTRAECAVVLCRLLDGMTPSEAGAAEPVSLVLNLGYLSMDAGSRCNLVATVFPMRANNQTVVWYSEDPAVAAVNSDGFITACSAGSTRIWAVSSNLLRQGCVVEVRPAAPGEGPDEPIPEPSEAAASPGDLTQTTEPAPETTEAVPTTTEYIPPATEAVPEPTPAPTEPVPETTEYWIDPAAVYTDETEAVWTDTPAEEVPAEVPAAVGRADMTDHEKDLMIFGEDVRDPRLYYADDDAALAHQVVIQVRTWDLADDGTKYTRTWNLQVHENIAYTAQLIFDEIYALEEKPVIHSMGGWRPNAGKSEHQPGLAIDINWLENYYCDPSGKAITGYYFRPGEDPYSIPIGGSIDQIFSKYGFIRGINWRNGYKDYMHYSFYGT